jgi:Xaa-Pro aminopeptidase
MAEKGEIVKRLGALRGEMKKTDLDAYFVFGTDPHMSEYPAARWKDRAWISGFTGSAGTVVITAEEAGLWTDVRYFLQAEKQLAGSGIRLFRQGEEGVPSPSQWLGSKLPPSATAGADGATLSLSKQRELKGQLAKYGILFRPTGDLIDRVWEDRPALPMDDIYQHDVRYAGADRRTKIGALREALEREQWEYQFLASLADIAWLFNLRGSDIDYNPLFLSFALVGREEVYLAVGQEKISTELVSLLEEEGVSLVPYEQVGELLGGKLEKRHRVAFDPDTTNSLLASIIAERGVAVERMNLTTEMKAVKSSTELAGFRRAMVKDGVAMTQFLYWLSRVWETGNLTEISIGEALAGFRSRQDGFMGESFNSIVGFREHGAIIHYSADEESSSRIDGPGLILIDSGGHYLDGTTDITRTVALGEPDEQQREDYTIVLKAHISLAMARFPRGSRGFQLDSIAKSKLWERGMQYTHGTGHGVGFFLNVHEGPQSISARLIDVPLVPGMVCSNEPGVYREGQYGIRIENLVHVREAFSTPFGDFFDFETLTLCPLDRKLIVPQLLSIEQLEWVNEYHRRVFEVLAPRLGEEERRWLEEETLPIGCEAC